MIVTPLIGHKVIAAALGCRAKRVPAGDRL
jgi:hypothetical protein